MEVILTHEHADFDAIAALVGLARLVPGAVAVLPQTVNANVAEFLTLYGRDLPLLAREDFRRRRVTRAWFVDTRNAAPVRGMTPATRRTVIDHHVKAGGGGGAGGGGLGESDGMAEGHGAGGDTDDDIQAVGATATLIAERMIAAGMTPPPIDATLLLLGIHEDTGSLTYPGTTPRDLRAAAWLVEAGADLDLLARCLRHSLSDAGRALYVALMESIETRTVAGHRIVIASAVAPNHSEEVSTLATKLGELLEPDALFILVDLGASIQVAARSLCDSVDAGAVAEALGGGGHAHAAAATIRGDRIGAVRERLIAALPAAVQAGPRVAEIMARGQVRTIAADATVEAALAFARRYGHEGYPVVDGAEVLGVLTRRDLDRALHHNLARTPVRTLITGHAVTVSPDDSVETLQQRMTTHGIGQMPVVEGGSLAGIVTRTDVLHLWASRARRETLAHAHVNLAAALRPADIDAIHQIAAVGHERGDRAFLVGGLPRDLLLGVPPGPDIDLVIEGDAVELAEAVAARYGGRVRAHKRFGTAKWIRAGVAIDLVGARAEFYHAPSELPTVERGSLRSDLGRRDFTINTLAIDVDPRRFGQVIDWFNGLADLREGRLRVLHPLSFVEDPTRILRAVRFENRFGFALEAGTAALVPSAVALLGRTSGQRIRNELRQLFAEPDPATALRRLDDLGALSAISAGLTPGTYLGRMLDILPAAWSLWQAIAPLSGLPAGLAIEHGLMLWLAEQGDVGIAAADRLRLPRAEIDRIKAIAGLWKPGPELQDPAAPPSTVYHCLKRFPPEVILLAWVGMLDPIPRRCLLYYAGELAGVSVGVTGADLAQTGLPSGPLYGQVLRAVLDARLDGRVASRDDELDLAKRLAAKWADQAAT